MDCKMQYENNCQNAMPPGFRFHPTEEELVGYYLRTRVEGREFPVHLITILQLYRHDPWELPHLAIMGEKEWFFFVPRDKKYKNAARPNRVTKSGYWKATGGDKQIKQGNHVIGLRKTLVFYIGRAPSGEKTDWIMNEYRMPDSTNPQKSEQVMSLCRIYNKGHSKGLVSKYFMQQEDEISECSIENIQQSPSKLQPDSSLSRYSGSSVSDQVSSCYVPNKDQNMCQSEGRKSILSRISRLQHLKVEPTMNVASWGEGEDLNSAFLFLSPRFDQSIL